MREPECLLSSTDSLFYNKDVPLNLCQLSAHLYQEEIF